MMEELLIGSFKFHAFYVAKCGMDKTPYLTGYQEMRVTIRVSLMCGSISADEADKLNKLVDKCYSIMLDGTDLEKYAIDIA